MQEFKTEPFAHQREDLERSRDLPGFAIWHEQGLGKSKLTIDTAAYLLDAQKIRGVLVIAPDSVVPTWTTEQLPQHLLDRLREAGRTMAWSSASARTRWHQEQLWRVLRHQGPAWLVMGYSGFMTKAGKRAAWEFMRRRDGHVLHVLDEARRIKTPGAKRSKSLIASAKHSTYRRVLDGTPLTNGPFDAYNPIRFLDPGFWKRRSIGDFLTFKHTFGRFRRMSARGRSFDQLIDYQDLDKLKEWVAPISSRRTKDEVLDLPAKLYQTRHFQLTAEQKRLYEQLKKEYRALLRTGDEIDASLAIVRLLRFQQVTCGYLPTERDEEPMHDIPGGNPRLDLLEEVIEDCACQVLVWCRFRRDVDLICRRLGRRAARYDGRLGIDEREREKARFKAGEAQAFVSNAAVGGEGLTLIEARAEVYYSNSFKLDDRLQSEDRAHRIGQDRNVTIIDLMATNTVDARIRESLRNKRDVASQVTGDEIHGWLSD